MNSDHPYVVEGKTSEEEAQYLHGVNQQRD